MLAFVVSFAIYIVGARSESLPIKSFTRFNRRNVFVKIAVP
jgi:hypothetical protein